MKGLAVRVPEYITCIRTDLYIWDVADTLEVHSGIVPTDPDPTSRSRRARIARKFMIQSGIEPPQARFLVNSVKLPLFANST